MDTVSVKTDSKSICARGVGCIPYLTVPYLTYTFYEGGRGRTISFPDATRHTSRLQPRLLRLAHGGHTTYLFFHSISISTQRHINIERKKHLSDCHHAHKLPPERYHHNHHNLYESCRIRPCHFHISHISQFFLHACDGVCNSLSETISIYFFPDLPSDLSPSPDER